MEVLDLANCSGPFAKQELLGDPADNPATPALTLPRVPWPPALRELKLGGVRLSLGLLYGAHPIPSLYAPVPQANAPMLIHGD